VLSQDEIERAITYDDEIWDMVEEDPDVDSSELLDVLFYSMLEELTIESGENYKVVCNAEDMLNHDNIPCDISDMYQPWEPNDRPQFPFNVSVANTQRNITSQIADVILGLEIECLVSGF
jgi:hypothetical protein